MKWSNVAAWLLSAASLAFAADPKLAKNLDVVAAIAPAAFVPASFLLRKIPLSYYRNMTSTGLSPAYDKRDLTLLSDTNALWANALWGSSTLAGFGELSGSDVRTGAEPFKSNCAK